jgi:murein DD-endopeptidase MepM/ murein hydrolase activator NlpD
MTRTFTIRASLVAFSTLSLAACETPNYPTHTNTPTPTPGPTAATAPSAPIQTPAPSAPAPTPQTAPSSAAVDTQTLPPVASAPVRAPPPAPQATAPSPAQSAVPPDYTPPSPASVEPPPPEEPPPPQIHYRNTPERVVAGGPVVAARGMYRDYVVQPKDHVDAIARDLETTRKMLVDANHLKAPYALQPGQHLKVPVAKAYEVQAGDTMVEIAKRFGVSVGELSDLNDLSAKAKLRPGDSVALPDGYHDHGPTRLPGTQIAERVPEWAPPRTYATSPRRASPPAVEADGAPYSPSPEALAAAQRLAAERSYTARTVSPAPAASPRPAPYSSAERSAPAQLPTNAQLAVASAGRGRFIWPLRGDIISPFGLKGLGRRNDGIDVRSPQGAEVHAAAAGDVVYAGDQVPGFGNLVLVKHSDGWVTAYAHLLSIGVQMRQTVMQGQILGQVGSTGGVVEPQLHFEIRYAATPSEKAKPVDPLLILPK